MSLRLGWLEKLAMLVPGYRGYKRRELLREDDAILRRYVADKLREASKMLQDAAEELARRLGGQAVWLLQQPGNPVQALNDYARKLYTLAGLVENLELGYSPSFSRIKVQEEELRKLMEIDNRMVGYTSVALETARIILGQARGQGWFDVRLLQTIGETVTSIESVVEERRRFLHGGGAVEQGELGKI